MKTRFLFQSLTKQMHSRLSQSNETRCRILWEDYGRVLWEDFQSQLKLKKLQKLEGEVRYFHIPDLLTGSRNDDFVTNV